MRIDPDSNRLVSPVGKSASLPILKTAAAVPLGPDAPSAPEDRTGADPLKPPKRNALRSMGSMAYSAPVPKTAWGVTSLSERPGNFSRMRSWNFKARRPPVPQRGSVDAPNAK